MTPLYHITHLKNLPAVMSAGGLWCDRVREERNLTALGIAHQHIKDRRKRKAVSNLMGREIAAGGTLWDYVPFYFAPRSPMLFTLHKGNVEGYDGGQRPVIHLETTVEAAIELGRSFAFTNGHGDMAISDFCDDSAQLHEFVDWEIMKSDFWNDTADQPDRKRRRQAEFLVHQFFPWKAIIRIGVIDRQTASQVGLILAGNPHQPEILVAPRWYY